ncbi:GNAT family N-acetyltransferase [Pseudokineococcus basanitobsidens]|uniref:GNAT family N-acetyltransferase n=1 Tax=Pseudokineococcus basanitobsidens TaxID=1926649 RepID=A0ABU8RFH6_9ACTN
MTRVAPVDVRDPEVLALVDALTAELATGGYAEDETFGYTAEQLAASAVHLLGARAEDGTLVGIAGVELDGAGGGELKRFYVAPAHRGTGVADALLEALVPHARAHGADVLRLETGDAQAAALRFYARHGFRPVPRFGPYVDSATSVCLERRLGPS